MYAILTAASAIAAFSFEVATIGATSLTWPDAAAGVCILLAWFFAGRV